MVHRRQPHRDGSLIRAALGGTQKLYNPIVIRLLRSPLHGVMSGSTMLVTYAGRRSGRKYTVPVNYVRAGNNLLVVGSREHSWWKNLRGGAPVTVRVRGWDMKGVGEAFEDQAAEEGLIVVLRAVPAYRRYWKIELDSDGRPKDPRVLRRVAAANAFVRIRGLFRTGQT